MPIQTFEPEAWSVSKVWTSSWLYISALQIKSWISAKQAASTCESPNCAALW